MASTDETDDGTTVDVTERETAHLDATQVLPGDDIAVIPGPPDGGNRRRAAWIAGAVAALIVIAGAIALATRDDEPDPVVATDSTPTTVAAEPKPPAVANKPKAKKPAPTTPAAGKPVAAPPQSTPVPASIPSQPVAAPPSVPTPTVAPTTIPAAAPVSVVKWTAPKSVTLKTGTSTVISLSAHNPATGAVSLPRPLSCAPTLDTSEMCPQVIEKIQPGQTAGAQWTVNAVGIAPGKYTLNFAGILNIPVTVTS